MKPYPYLERTLERLKECKTDEAIRVTLRSFAGGVESLGTISPKNERDLLIVRLNTIKSNEDGYSANMRWKYIKYNNKHVRDIDPTELSDSELVEFFEIILRQYYKQF